VRTNRRAYIVVVAVFLAVIMVPGLIQTVSELRHGERPRSLDIFLQPPTARNLHGYEQSLEETSLVINQFRPWMQYIEWRYLDDAGEKAVVGRHGWLFYRPSVRYLIERETGAHESVAASPLAAIRSFRDQLQAQGIRLLVVPVPNKESIYPGMLAKRAEDAGVVVSEQTRRLLGQLEQCGIEHVDLFEVFRRARQGESRSDPRRLYLTQDTGFIAHVARELGQPLSSIVNDGGASTLVRQTLARRPALLSNKKLVIWEFAERDIRYGTEGWQIVPLARSKTTPR
jgi:hypothetical protein